MLNSQSLIATIQITDKEEAGKAILAACAVASSGQDVAFGTYRGLNMSVQYDPFSKKIQLTLHGAASHRMEVGNDARGNIIRLDNAIAQIGQNKEQTTEHLVTVHKQVEAAKAELGKPFPQEAELRTKSGRLAVLDAELNMDKQTGEEQPKKKEQEQ